MLKKLLCALIVTASIICSEKKSNDLKTENKYLKSLQPFPYYHHISSYSSTKLEMDFIEAIKTKNLKAAKELIAKGVDVNICIGSDFPKMGFVPLMPAIYNNHIEMAELLINSGADVNEIVNTGGISDDVDYGLEDNMRNNSLLSYAIIINKPEMVKLLIKYKVDINKVGPFFTKWTPIEIAKYNNREEILKILSDANAKT